MLPPVIATGANPSNSNRVSWAWTQSKNSSRVMRGQSALEHGADVREVLATPEKLAVDDEARHPEDALFLGGTADCFDLAPAFVGAISRKASRVGASLDQNRLQDFGVLDVELALPEPLEDDVVIAA